MDFQRWAVRFRRRVLEIERVDVENHVMSSCRSLGCFPRIEVVLDCKGSSIAITCNPRYHVLSSHLGHYDAHNVHNTVHTTRLRDSLLVIGSLTNTTAPYRFAAMTPNALLRND